VRTAAGGGSLHPQEEEEEEKVQSHGATRPETSAAESHGNNQESELPAGNHSRRSMKQNMKPRIQLEILFLI